MRTGRSLPYGGVSLTETPWTEIPPETPWTETPRQRPPWTEPTPPDRDLPAMWPVMHAGTGTPCEQNDTQV